VSEPELPRRHPRAHRILSWVAGLILVPLLLIVVAVFWVTSTQSGARWAFARLGLLMKGGLTVGEIQGPLKGPLTVKNLHYKSPALEAHIAALTLRWRLGKLLQKQLDIESLTADGVTITPATKETKEETKLSDIHLPVNFVVRDATVTRVVITSGVPANPRRVDSIRLATSSRGDTVHVESLAVRGPDFDFDASGDVTPTGDYPVDLKVAWTSTRAGTVPFGGHGTLGGSLEKLTVVHDIERPFIAHVDSVLTTPLRELKFEGKVAFDKLQVKDLNKDWPDAVLGGTIAARGEPEVLTAEGAVHVATPMMDVGRADTAFHFARNHDDWKFQKVHVTLPGRPTVLEADATIHITKDTQNRSQMSLAVDAGWKGVVWPLAGKPTIESPAGKANVKGTLDAFDVKADADFRGPSIPPGHWTLEGSGTQERMKISSFVALIFGGRISGSGEVGWKPDVSWNLAAKGENVNPATQAKEWAGSIAFTASSQGKMTKAGPVAGVELPDAHGTLHGQPFTAVASFRLDGEDYFIRRLEVGSGSAKASASGRAGRVYDLTWQVSAPNIGNLVSGYSGSIDAKGRLDGPKATPHVVASVNGQSLSTGAQQITKLAANADVDLRPRGKIHVDAAVEGIKASGRSIDTVTLAGDGTREAHQATLAVVARNADKVEKLTAGAIGGFDAKMAWRGQIARLDLESPEVGTWHLQRPAALTQSKEGNSLQGFCWIGGTSGSARLCADAATRTVGTGTDWNAKATLAALPMNMFKPFLPPDVEIAGTIDGRVDAKASAAGTLYADVDVKPAPGTLTYPETLGKKKSVAYHDVFLTAKADAGGLVARAGAVLDGVGTLGFDANLPQYNVQGLPAPDQVIRAHIKVDVADLGFVQGFYQGVEKVAGAFHVDLAIGGTRGSPTVVGGAKLQDVAADLPEYGLELRDLEVNANAQGGGLITMDGHLRSGKGTVTLKGSSPLTPSDAQPLKLHLEGTDFVARNTAEMKILVSPKVDVVMRSNRHVDATGDVTVPDANIEMKKKFATVTLSKDIVIIGPRGAEQPTKAPWLISSRVRLILPESDLAMPNTGVRFKGMGLAARFQGSLLTIDEPGKPTTATGQIEIIGGTYKAYGQDLTIEKGRVFYAGGPLDNPGVDLKAYRKARDGTIAGVIVKGSLEAPETTLYSDPTMAQSDQLAYILLGHPLGQSTQSEGSLVANAAASLGLKGGNLLAKKIAGKLGLEEAQIETEGSYKEANLVVGKYLSPKFYVQYGIGLFTGDSMLRINYILSKSWTLRAETKSQANGADILYTREK
jgi:translocation and assembly module TamB